MRTILRVSLVVAALLMPAIGLAQAASPGAEVGAALRERALDAIRLPSLADRVRERGVPAEDVGEALQALRDAGADAGEVADVLEAEGEISAERGPSDNFGAAVQEHLAAGLRGRDLAAAIRADHTARRRDRGESRGRGERNEEAGRGRHEGSGAGVEERRPDSPGQEEAGGRRADRGPGREGTGERARPDNRGRDREGTGDRVRGRDLERRRPTGAPRDLRIERDRIPSDRPNNAGQGGNR